jgi:hypothetical protein
MAAVTGSIAIVAILAVALRPPDVPVQRFEIKAHAAATPPHTNANLRFGPVIEREVKDEEWIDFDSGRLTKMPEFETAGQGFGSIGERVAAGTTWLEQEGMDALFGGSSLNAFGMKVHALPSGQWNGLPASELDAVLSSIDPKVPPLVVLAPAKDGSDTFAIQTREGGRGILQVVALGADSVKVRYKLLQREPESTGRGRRIE